MVDGPLPAQLSLAPGVNQPNFGNVEVGVASAPKTVMLVNAGGQTTGPLSLTNDNPQEITVTGCSGTLAPGAPCALSIVFRAGAAGSRTGMLTIQANPGGILVAYVYATGAVRITTAITGTGTVTSTPAGLTCNGASCSGLFASSPVLHAMPGTDQRFTAWTGGGCPADVNRDCKVALSGPTTVGVSFGALAENLAFITSGRFPSNLGAVTNYDDKCNAAATTAGLNDSSGKAFVALMSSSSSAVSARLGNARGWIRLDGKPLFDTLSTAFGMRQLWNAIALNELGASAGARQFVYTGLERDGTASASWNCTEWTGNGQALGGLSDSGPVQWASYVYASCGQTLPIICLGKTRTTTVKPIVTAGKLVWTSPDPFINGGGKTPDAVCQASKPSGVTTAVALIATSTRAASSVLSATTSYVRPDGTLVGTGAQLAAGTLLSGIWQTGNGTYDDGMHTAWTGSQTPNAVGTMQDTCSNWTDGAATSQANYFGYPGSVSDFWALETTTDCGATNRVVYCVQTAP